MTAEALAGVDIGSTRTKAVVCTAGGAVLGAAQRPTPLGEKDAGALAGTALDALGEALAAAGRPPAAVGLTGMAETGAPLDRDGRPTGPLLAWSDPRGAEQAARLVRDVGAADLHATTGVRPGAKAPLAKWRMLAEQHPGTLAAMYCWAGAADLVAHALTGVFGTDATFAQRTMAYDVHRSRWDPDLLALGGLTPERLPRVREPGEPVGRVTAGAARRVPGLASGTPVVVAGHDHLVGAWAAGVRTAGAVADSMGTAEAVLTLSAQPPDARGALREGMGYGRHVDGRHWLVLAGSGSCGALLEWHGDLLGLPRGAQRHHRFTDLLAAAGPGPTGIVVEPYLHGRAAPEPDPGRRVALHGLGPHDGAPRTALAVVEATAYQARWMTGSQHALTGGEPPHQVVLLGGPTAQPRWPRVKAAVSPWPVRVLPEHRAPAVGAALLAAGAAGLPPPPPLATRPQRAGPDEDTARYEQMFHASFLPLVRRPAAGHGSPPHPPHPPNPTRSRL